MLKKYVPMNWLLVGFLPWQLAGNQSGSEEVFMGSQDGISQGRRDSQGMFKKHYKPELIVTATFADNF